ncbi:MAG TPA: lamin tail domain-containing protein, partial [Verrucomicrobiae bacterium]|nr:lamin tail domain-containing protein [Verrucomicrobiae bacterium]
RNILGYNTFQRAGSPYHYVVSVRVQQNGAFWGDANLLENGDENFLKRLGMDENGSLYKMYATFTDPSHTTGANAEKKTRKTENNADLTALYNGLGLGGAALRNYVYDNVNIPEVINYLAARILIGDVDCCHKNYYFYRDSEGTGEWQMLPWDIDLSFGRVWNGTQTYWDQVLHPDTAGNLDTGNNNRLPIAMYNTVDIRQMFLRRFRTLADDMLGAPGTLPEDGYYEKQIDQLIPLLAPDAALDLAKWGTWGNGAATSLCCVQSLLQAAEEIRNSYLPARRAYVYARPILPAAQPTNTVIQIAAVDYNPASSNQAEEYIQLRNTNNFSVDISGWRLSGGIDYTFQGGVVIPTNGSVYVVPDVKAFRARTAGPRGGQGLFVQGNYEGQLSARGENLALLNLQGHQIFATNLPPTPSAVQSFLRITEIMYHPPLPGLGSTNLQEDFEYIELKNVGPQTLNLNGVRFIEGIEFSFTGSSITNLGAGESVLVVKSRVAFEERYGPSSRVAGEYIGSLNNSGETIRLDDATNEKILDFDYNNAWYPVTDGLGFSLVIVNPLASHLVWGDKVSWRPSGSERGSPGTDDPTPAIVPIVLVNEALTHSDLPAVDAVELYNPGTNDVNLGGWYLSDDLFDPKKFRIPAGTMILAGGYRIFDEHQFNPNPGQPGNFSFSSSGGDEVYLFSGNANGELTGYFHGFDYGAAQTGVSFGRYLTSQGAEHFVAQSEVTLGASNAPPKVGPLVISEIMYHPRDLRSGIEIIENTQDEYIEIRNISGSPVALFDSGTPTNTWQLNGAVEFAFPTNVTLQANAVILVVSFNPISDPNATARFRSQFNISATIPLYGPFSGQLDDSAERIDLRRPDAPEGGAVPSILVDRVDYQDAGAWPPAADGIGASLHRISGSAYGNDPANWAAAGVTPGTPYVGGLLPVVTVQPASHSAVAFTRATLSVSVEGAQPFTYQWRFGGTNIFGADSNLLVLNGLKPSDAGLYSVVIFNPVGSVVSSNAELTVLIPAKILTQPLGLSVRPGTNVTFTVDAASNTPIHYQWRRNGQDIVGADMPSYTV